MIRVECLAPAVRLRAAIGVPRWAAMSSEVGAVETEWFNAEMPGAFERTELTHDGRQVLEFVHEMGAAAGFLLRLSRLPIDAYVAAGPQRLVSLRAEQQRALYDDLGAVVRRADSRDRGSGIWSYDLVVGYDDGGPCGLLARTVAFPCGKVGCLLEAIASVPWRRDYETLAYRFHDSLDVYAQPPSCVAEP